MPQCIYCRTTLLGPDEEGDDRLRPSREHIIHNALGGPNGLATLDVCRGCNGDLGQTVDAAFINQTVIGMLRQQFKLPGYSGKVPDVVLSMRSVQTNEPGRITIPVDGEVDVSHHPVVIRERLENGDDRLLIAGTRDDVERILSGIAAKEAAAGRRLVDQDGNDQGSVEDALLSAESELSTSYSGQLSVDLTALKRGLAKIAFGFAHLVLGAAWTLSPRADRLRSAARGLSDHQEVDALLQRCDVRFCARLLDDESDPSERHLIALLPTDPPQILVSLFGNPVLTATFALDASRTEVEEAVIDRALVSVYPGRADTRWIGLFEYSKRILRRTN